MNGIAPYELSLLKKNIIRPLFYSYSSGKDWHKTCLKCHKCSKTLSPGSHAENNGNPYCHKPCYATLFGPSGTGTGSHADFYKLERWGKEEEEEEEEGEERKTRNRGDERGAWRGVVTLKMWKNRYFRCCMSRKMWDKEGKEYDE